MTLQNRVNPFGIISADPARGLFMGNRGGKIHDPETQTLLGRTHATRQWITCLTAFRGRRRDVMGVSYTELFFLDEVTALAAGHRPCAECRRDAFKRYCAAVVPSFGETPRAGALDAELHSERMAERPNLTAARCAALPDSAMVAVDGMAFAKRGNAALPWRFSGYGAAEDWKDISVRSPVLLTPMTSICALENGYLPVWHPDVAP